jgi:cytochrome c oxidase subunit III
MNKEQATVESAHVGTEGLSRNPMHMGMVFFLISEAFLFGSLFWTYYYLRAETAVWPPAGVELNITLAGLNTFFLLASSVSIWWAGGQIRKGSQRGLAIGLIITMLLGLTFLGITISEWLHESFRPWTNAYGSIFFTLTGFHALHVFGGIMLMLILLTRTLRHRFSSGKHLAIDIGSLYWHYVDFIWLIVFSTLFIVK